MEETVTLWWQFGSHYGTFGYAKTTQLIFAKFDRKKAHRPHKKPSDFAGWRTSY